MLIEIVSATLFTPFLIRMLGDSEYGVYQLVISITSYLMLFDMGVGNAVIRYIAKYRTNNDIQKQQELLGVVTVFYLIIATIIIIIGVVLCVLFPIIFAKGLS